MLSADRKRGGNGFERYFDECTATPFLFNSRTRTLISYNDAESAHAVAVSSLSLSPLQPFFVFSPFVVVPCFSRQNRQGSARARD